MTPLVEWLCSALQPGAMKECEPKNADAVEDSSDGGRLQMFDKRSGLNRQRVVIGGR